MRFSLRGLFAALRPPRTPYDRAVAALERGDAPLAIAELSAYLHAAPDDRARVRAYNKRGVAYVESGNRDEAVRDFREALALDPTFAPAIANVGNLLFEEGDVPAAIEHYLAAIRADEKYAVAHLNLSVAYRRLGRRSEAVAAMRKAHRLEGRLLFGRAPRERHAKGD